MKDFKSRALRLKDRGYRIVPIRKGEKGPHEAGWQSADYSDDEIRAFAERGYAQGNIGINTRETPAVDIDVYDEAISVEMGEWIMGRFGATCVRIGRAPKRLLLFRTDEPFRKMYCTYSDGKTDHKVEILGAGQQFVAYGVHPETNNPYTWVSFDEPLELDASDLPLLTHETAQEILDQFGVICERAGWVRISSSLGGKVRDTDADDFSTYKVRLNISDETVVSTLDMLPNDDLHYDEWLEVGFALHHQYSGGHRGLELWHEWGQQSSKYDAQLTDYKYGSMGHGPDTATFATLMYKARIAREKAEDLAFQSALNRITSTNNSKTLINEVVRDLAKSAMTDIQRDMAIRAVQNRLGEIDNSKPRLESVRKAFDKHTPKKKHHADVPKWCENWYFIESENIFFNTQTGARIVRQAFDAKYGRMLLSDEMRDEGESFGGKASDIALNVHQIPTVYRCVYWPGYDQVINIDGLDCVNTFNNNLTPPSVEPTNHFEIEAVEKCKKHFEILFPDERERNLVIDFLAYTVQYPKEKITWGILIQGVDGAGKSWIQSLMSAAIGGVNVNLVNGSSLLENFTSWAEGYRMVFIEEVRIKGLHKYEIVNKMKPYIANPTVPVRRMRNDPYKVRNVTNYVLFTNYIDALPLDRSDRRYLVVRTAFQTVSHIRKFMDENPTYFEDIFNIVDFDGPCLRYWLSEHKISDEFRPKGYAPDTEAKRLMIEESEETDETEDLEELINSSADPFISNEVLSLHRLRTGDMSRLNSLPRRSMGSLLARCGFSYVGKYRLGSQVEERIYTRHSELFEKGDKLAVIKRLTQRAQIDDGFGDDALQGFDNG
jgi:hypothetical protein